MEYDNNKGIFIDELGNISSNIDDYIKILVDDVVKKIDEV